MSTAATWIRALAGALVDRRMGVLGELSLREIAPGTPTFILASAELGDLSACGWRVGRVRLDAAAATPDRAAMRAITKAMSIHCAALFDPRELPLASAEEASFPCAAPSSFSLFPREQYASPGFPFAPFTDATRVRWAPAVDAETGEPCFAPAAMVVFPYPTPPQWPGEAAIAPPSTAGLACAEGVDEATVAAVCDAIRADALSRAGQTRRAPAQIARETLPDREVDLVDRLERSGGTVTLLDGTGAMGIPAVLAVLQSGAPAAPALVLAGGAAPEPAEAARAALEDLALALAQGAAPATGPLAELLLSSTRRVALAELPSFGAASARATARALIAAAACAGHRVLLADLTLSDARGLGLAIVRAILPGLHWLPSPRGGRRGPGPSRDHRDIMEGGNTWRRYSSH